MEGGEEEKRDDRGEYQGDDQGDDRGEYRGEYDRGDDLDEPREVLFLWSGIWTGPLFFRVRTSLV